MIAQRQPIRRQRRVEVALTLQRHRLVEIIEALGFGLPSDLPPIRRLHQDMRLAKGCEDDGYSQLEAGREARRGVPAKLSRLTQCEQQRCSL